METLLEYKCPACGGAIEFDATSQKLKCPYCNTKFDVSVLRELDEVLSQEKPSNYSWDIQPHTHWSEEEKAGMQTFVCQSCGGEIVGDSNTAATNCPYCDNPVVVADRFSADLRPDLVVPFKLDKTQAMEALEKHLSNKPLLPKLFKAQNRLESIQGVYVPFWMFDADADANVRYRATRVRHWSDDKYNYIRTSYFTLIRDGIIGFANVPVDGSSQMPNELMESIEPFDLSQGVDFQTAYLAGYLADKFDLDAEECIARANARIRASTEAAFLETTGGYASVTPENSNIRLFNGQVRYALLPVWMITTNYQGKSYTFAMNGQTGKMVGNLPIDWKRFVAYLLSIGLGSGALISLITSLLG